MKLVIVIVTRIRVLKHGRFLRSNSEQCCIIIQSNILIIQSVVQSLPFKQLKKVNFKFTKRSRYLPPQVYFNAHRFRKLFFEYFFFLCLRYPDGKRHCRSYKIKILKKKHTLYIMLVQT